MNEMLQMAQERHDQILKNISQREADIAKLNAEAEKLETFVELAKELFAQKEQTAPAAEKPQAPPPSDANRIMPVRQASSA